MDDFPITGRPATLLFPSILGPHCVWVMAVETENAMPIARTFVIHLSLRKMQIDGGNSRVFVSLWLLPNCSLSLFPRVDVMLMPMSMSLHRAQQPHFGISEWQIKLIHFHLWSRVWVVDSSAQGKSFKEIRHQFRVLLEFFNSELTIKRLPKVKFM